MDPIWNHNSLRDPHTRHPVPSFPFAASSTYALQSVILLSRQE